MGSSDPLSPRAALPRARPSVLPLANPFSVTLQQQRGKRLSPLPLRSLLLRRCCRRRSTPSRSTPCRRPHRPKRLAWPPAKLAPSEWRYVRRNAELEGVLRFLSEESAAVEALQLPLAVEWRWSTGRILIVLYSPCAKRAVPQTVSRPQADKTREWRESPNLKSSYQSRVTSEIEEVDKYCHCVMQHIENITPTGSSAFGSMGAIFFLAVDKACALLWRPCLGPTSTQVSGPTRRRRRQRPCPVRVTSQQQSPRSKKNVLRVWQTVLR